MKESTEENRQRFCEWLSKTMSKTRAVEIDYALGCTDALWKKRGLLKRSIYDVDDAEKVKSLIDAAKLLRDQSTWSAANIRKFKTLVYVTEKYYDYLVASTASLEPEPVKSEPLASPEYISPIAISLVDTQRRQFVDWVFKKYSDSDTILHALSLGETFLRKQGALKGSIFGVKDSETIRKLMRTLNTQPYEEDTCWTPAQLSAILGATAEYHTFVTDVLPPATPMQAEVKRDEVIKAEQTQASLEDISAVEEPRSRDYDSGAQVKSKGVQGSERIDLNAIQNLRFTKPTLFIFRDYRDDAVRSWTDLYVKLVTMLYAAYPDKVPVGKSFSGEGMADLGDASCTSQMHAPKPIQNGLYLETNRNSGDIVQRIKMLLDLCGVDYRDLTIDYCKKGSGESKTTTEKPTQKATPSKLTSWTSALRTNFPEGIKFDPPSVKLLASVVGKACVPVIISSLKKVMMRRSDGVYLLSSQILSGVDVSQMVSRARELGAEHGCFSLSILLDEFASSLKNLLDLDRDFGLFLEEFVLPKLSKRAEIVGKKQRQICVLEANAKDKLLEGLAKQLRDILQERGDAVLEEELDDALPCLNSAAIEMLFEDYISDAVVLTIDEMKYWKLLEAFYLSDDFSTTVTNVINVMDRQKILPSIKSIEAKLDLTYSKGFRETYALDDDDVFRQVILASYKGEKHVWKGTTLVKEGVDKIGIIDEFLQTHTGVFHEEEFFKYAAINRGLFNTTALVCHNLRNSCIRLDGQHWISREEFDQESNFSDEMAESIAQKVEMRLGAEFYLPLGKLPDAFMSALPTLTIGERVYYWNAYMLTSVAATKIPALRIVNDEPSPYTVTACAIPSDAAFNGDILEYIFENLRASGRQFKSSSKVFEYLKANQVRMTNTVKLKAIISKFWDVK